MTNLPVKTEPTSVAISSQDAALGRSQLTQGRIDAGGEQPKEIKIIHAKGKFHSPDLDESWDALTGVTLIAVIIQRSMFPAKMKSGNEKNEPFCRSGNGIAGFPNKDTFDYETYYPSALGAAVLDCGTCEASNWNNGEAPPCKEKFRFVFTMDQAEGNFTATFGGTSYKNARKHLQSFSDDEPLWVRSATFRLEEQQNGTNIYSVLQVAVDEDDVVPEGEWPVYAEESAKWLPYYSEWVPKELKDELAVAAEAEVVES